MKHTFNTAAAVLILLFSTGCWKKTPDIPVKPVDFSGLDENSGVWETLLALGESPPEHYLADFPDETIEAGKELVFTGKAKNPETGLPGPRISDYFYCTDCHNVKAEEPNIASVSDSIVKLEHATSNKLPLLQGSTFAGMVNRETWYNGDYAKKYRFSLAVRAARKSLRESIKLCSRECSQGRDPLPWEEEAMLAYFWTLEWKLSNLGYTSADVAELKRRALDPASRSGIVSEIKAKYALTSPATFSGMPEDGKAGYPVEGEKDLKVGQIIWEQSCLHCHGAEGASEHYFGDKPDVWSSLARKFKSSSKKSVYGFIRLGTHPEEGKRPYMPNYTTERLSDKQIEDLRAYIESKAAEAK